MQPLCTWTTPLCSLKYHSSAHSPVYATTLYLDKPPLQFTIPPHTHQYMQPLCTWTSPLCSLPFLRTLTSICNHSVPGQAPSAVYHSSAHSPVYATTLYLDKPPLQFTIPLHTHQYMQPLCTWTSPICSLPFLRTLTSICNHSVPGQAPSAVYHSSAHSPVYATTLYLDKPPLQFTIPPHTHQYMQPLCTWTSPLCSLPFLRTLFHQYIQPLCTWTSPLCSLPFLRTLFHQYMQLLFLNHWKRVNSHRNEMSLVVRKPVFGVFDQVRHKLGCTATEDG